MVFCNLALFPSRYKGIVCQEKFKVRQVRTDERQLTHHFVHTSSSHSNSPPIIPLQSHIAPHLIPPHPHPIMSPTPPPTAQVNSLDHLVLTTLSLPLTISFYTHHLGMTHHIFKSDDDGSERHALRFGDQKINLHELGREFEPKARDVRPGSLDLCFVTDRLVERVLEGFGREGVEVSWCFCFGGEGLVLMRLVGWWDCFE